MVAYLNRLLQLSRPPLLPHLTLTRAQEMVHAHCYLATDYSAELQEWGSGELHTRHTVTLPTDVWEMTVLCGVHIDRLSSHR